MQAIHTLGASIRAELARRGYSQAALGEHLGLSQAAVHRRINGDVDFSVPQLTATAEFLDLTVEYLLRSGRAA